MKPFTSVPSWIRWLTSGSLRPWPNQAKYRQGVRQPRFVRLAVEDLEKRLVPTSVTSQVVNNSGFPLVFDSPDTQISINGYIAASGTNNGLQENDPPGVIPNGGSGTFFMSASGTGVEADFYFYLGNTGVKDDLFLDNPFVGSNTYHQTFLPDNGFFQSGISGGGGVDADVTYTVSSIGGNLGIWGNVSAGPTSPFSSAESIPSSDGAMNMLLLPNGNVMIHGAGNSSPRGSSPNWYLLQPDSSGAYSGTNAQITNLQPMSTGRRFFATDVLPNDTVFAFGGEYSGVTLNGNTTTGSAVVTGLSSTSQLVAGMLVTGTGIPAPTITGTTTSGSASVTGLSSTSGLAPGMIVSGTGIAAGSVILTVDTASSITLSANATASGSNSLTFNTAIATVDSSSQITLVASATATGTAVSLTFSGQTELDTGEFYNPATNSWSPLPQLADTSLSFGDQDAELVNVAGKAFLLASDPDSRGSAPSSQSFLFNVPNTAANSNDAAGAWTATGNQVNPGGLPSGDSEDNWTLLPNGDVLAYQVAISDASANASAELYVPSGGTIPAGDGGGTSTGQWVNASTGLIQLTSGPPFPPANAGPQDMGPGVLLPNLASFNGSALNGPAVIYFGWNGSTAYYNPATNSWASGPTEPIYGGLQMSSPDGPAAVLPDGEVLVALSPQTPAAAGANYYPTPTRLYLFNPNGNFANGTPFMDVTPPDSQLANTNCYQESMLELPTGQVLMSDSSNTLWIYTPTGTTATPVPGTQPTITSITKDPSTGLYQINGTQLNGPNEGAYYGDDEQMSSNYPLVQLIDSSGHVSYATTSNWQAGIVAGGTSADFALPAGTSLTSFASITLVADLLRSATVGLTAPVVNGPGNQSAVEGASQAFNLGSFVDPNGGPWSVDVNWGDGTPDTIFTASTAGTLATSNHAYSEEGLYTPKVTVTDSTSLSDSATFQVTVSDPAVIPTGGSTFSAIEGALSTSQTVATFTDPGGAEALGDYSATIDWGDSTPISSGKITFNGTPGSKTDVFTVSGTHSYGEEGMATITVTISHDSTPTVTATTTANISDPAVLGTGSTISAIACIPLTGVTTATFTDRGGAEPNPSDPGGTIANHYQVVSIDWGDGTPLDTTSGTLSFGGSPGSKIDLFTVSGSHAYAQEGVYSITTILKHEGAPTTTVTSRAIVKDNIGLLVLDGSASGSLAVSGNGNVIVNNCGAVVVDSSSASAAIVTGNGFVSAMDIDVTGGTSVTGNGQFSGSIGHETPTADPIRLPLPPAPASTFAAVNYSGSGTLILAPGTYVGGIKSSGKGNVVLQSGVYYLKGGGLQLSGNSSITGSGVLIVNAPSNSNDGISLSGNASATLTALLPANLPSGYAAYKGITIFQDPSSTSQINISGNATLTMDGALYAPKAILNLGGALTDYTDTTAPVAEIIVDEAQVSGNGTLTIDADVAASNPPANTPLPGAPQANFVSFVSSANPAVPGQSVTLTATMSSSAGAPAGSIDFFDLTTHLDLGSVTLVGGVATLTTSAIMMLGNQTISATYFPASPNFAQPSAPATLTQQVQSEAIESGVLFVGGNPNSSNIQVSLSNGQVAVNLHDGSANFQTPLAGLTALVVYGQGNGEHIQVDSHLLLPAFLFAGNGTNVQIQGGGGPTVEVGGSGGGHLQGGLGRNILIAGSGGAQLQGGNGGSILIGGYTDYDTNLAALEAALTEWNSADSYATRTSSLALAIFNPTTVHSDGLSDQLQGGGGTTALDWFFASSLDDITRKNIFDTTVPIS